LILGFLLVLLVLRLTILGTPPEKKDIGKIIIGGFFILIGFAYTLYRILLVPSILIDDKGILLKTIFGSRSINWNEIESIATTGKRYRGIGLNSQESAVIFLKDKKRVISIQTMRKSGLR
jgi:hypothetical protein